MDALLLDTDVFSYLNKRGDTRGDLYRPHVKGKTIALTFITIGELYFWTLKRKWSRRRIAELEQHIKAAVIVPYDMDLCKEFGTVKASLDPARVIPSNDLWIATCAIRHSIPLATHNYKHFEGIPRLRIITEANRPAHPKTGNLFTGG
jgi:predicted nucleic acid-binding protein